MSNKEELKRVKDLVSESTHGNMSWLTDNMVYLVHSGSRSYGTDTEESDKDYKGIVIPPMNYHLGLQTFKSVQVETGSNDTKNTKEDVDITLYSLNEFVRLALKTNPNILEMLFVEESNVLVGNEELVNHRDVFLSNNLIKSYGGFGVSMMKRVNKKMLDGEYDGKTLMNLVRIFETGQEAMLTGTMTTKRKNSGELLHIRHGNLDVTNNEHQEYIQDLMEYKQKAFNKAESCSILPNKPNFNKAEEMLVRLTKEHLGI